MSDPSPVKPRLLDLFCGAGGAAMGYSRAGFEVVGVDHEPQPNYPFGFHQADALDVLSTLVAGGYTSGGERWGGNEDLLRLDDFDAIHASPPCQAYTHARHMAGRGRPDHPRLIEPVREVLEKAGLPYVIENVVGAPLRNPTLLCGVAVGLNVKRHRLFETNFLVIAPQCGCGQHRVKRFASTPRADGSRPLSAYVNPLASETTHDEFAEALGIDWVPARGKRPARELHEAIPPAYCELIGYQLMAVVESGRLAA